MRHPPEVAVQNPVDRQAHRRLPELAEKLGANMEHHAASVPAGPVVEPDNTGVKVVDSKPHLHHLGQGR